MNLPDKPDPGDSPQGNDSHDASELLKWLRSHDSTILSIDFKHESALFEALHRARSASAGKRTYRFFLWGD